MQKLTLGAVALAVSTVIGSTAGHALLVEGFLDRPAAALNPTISVVGGLGAPDFSVTRGTINFTATGVGTPFTVGTFLGPAGLAAGTASHDLTNTVLRITGDASAPGGIASILHDDGVQLGTGCSTPASCANLVINAPAPTSPITSTGNYGTAEVPFVLTYGECCGAPADLVANLVESPAPTPEPASLAILGAALAGLGVMRRRRRKTV